MRIALVNSEYCGPGGIGAYTRNLSKALTKQGHSVFILSKLDEDQRNPASPVTVLPVRRRPAKNRVLRGLGYRFFWEINLHLEYAGGVAEALEALFRANRIDIAEVPDFYGEAWALGIKHPYVCRLHTPWTLVRQWNSHPARQADRWIARMEKKTTRKAAGVSSPSAALLGQIPRSWMPQNAPHAVIPYPLADPTARTGSVKTFPTELLFLGRLERRKGFDWICRVLPEVLREFAGAGAGAVIAGAATQEARPWLEQLAQELRSRGLEERCRILGAVDEARASELMARADIVMVPSRFDNFPNVILEAMAAGRCVVACRAGGIPEMVEDNVSALLFAPEAGHEGLRRCLRQALMGGELRQRLGRAGRKAATRRYSPDVIAQQTVSFYQEVLSRWNP